jgi:hypothetical protein
MVQLTAGPVNWDHQQYWVRGAMHAQWDCQQLIGGIRDWSAESSKGSSARPNQSVDSQGDLDDPMDLDCEPDLASDVQPESSLADSQQKSSEDSSCNPDKSEEQQDDSSLTSSRVGIITSSTHF